MALPGHPPTGHEMLRSDQVKYILYIRGSDGVCVCVCVPLIPFHNNP